MKFNLCIPQSPYYKQCPVQAMFLDKIPLFTYLLSQNGLSFINIQRITIFCQKILLKILLLLHMQYFHLHIFHTTRLHVSNCYKILPFCLCSFYVIQLLLLVIHRQELPPSLYVAGNLNITFCKRIRKKPSMKKTCFSFPQKQTDICNNLCAVKRNIFKHNS